jgi:tonB-linked outer membrane protein, susC/ragA family
MKLTIYNYICFFVFGYFFSYSSSCCAFVADDVNHRLEVLIARKSIMGRVVDGDGVPLPGATVLEKGTSNGAVTDLEGKFALTVADDAVLRFSFMGYKTQEVSVKGHTFLDIVLEEDAVELDKVVVTALGIEKKEHSLSYAMSQVKSEELTRVKMPNLITSLTGKTAGVQVNQVSSGLGASAKVNIRGIRSVAGENQPLYVIDGVPMLNSTSEQAFSAIGGTANAGNRDGGDGISNLNSEDIESISILKGAPAAALYGSQAGNGVILITTKKGKSQGQRSISFSTSLMFDKASSLPEMQNRYGVSDGVDSWGERKDLPKYDNLNDFFSTGVTSITSVSVSHGNEKLQNYFSYANTTGKGIIDKNRLSKHNITFRETSVIFNNRLKLDGNVNLMRQVSKNKPTVGGFYMNPLVGLYRFPRGEDLSYYRNNFEVYDESRNLNIQNWHTAYEDFEQNPYWITNRIQTKEVRMHAIVSLSANLQVNDWLTVQARGNVDCIDDKVRQKFYASTAPALAGANGRYLEMDYQDLQFYGDLMLMMKKKWGDFSVNGAFGGSITDKTTNSTRYDSKTASLYYANVFTLANIIMNGSAALDQKIDSHRQLQSLFATAQVGYKESAYIDLTTRNDWSSTLSHTKHEGRGYFYPSVGTSLILSRLLTLPEWVSYAKVRAAYSMVGNDIPLYITNSASHITAGGEYLANDAAPFKEMEPEMNYSWEIGAEGRFLNSRIGFNITFYRTNTHNQFFKLPTLAGDKYAYRYVNAGNIQN